MIFLCISHGTADYHNDQVESSPDLVSCRETIFRTAIMIHQSHAGLDRHSDSSRLVSTSTECFLEGTIHLT